MKKYLLFLMCAWLSIPASAEEQEAEPADPSLDEFKTEVLIEVRNMVEHYLGNPDIPRPLGKTVRLEFNLIPPENEDVPLSVTSASTAYSTKAEFKSPDKLYRFAVEGDLFLLAKLKDRVGLTFRAHLEYEGEDGEGHMEAQGSAIVAIGESIELAQFGDRTLMVRVTE